MIAMPDGVDESLVHRQFENGEELLAQRLDSRKYANPLPELTAMLYLRREREPVRAHRGAFNIIKRYKTS